MPSVFEYEDYKAFLKEAIRRRQQRGSRTALARAMGCQSAYVTHVLGGQAELSLEQGERASFFLGLTESETGFFLLLVQIRRAGSAPLKELLLKQKERLKAKQSGLGDRIRISGSLRTPDRALYYSDWKYAAVHVAVTIPSLRTEDALARHLGLSKSAVRETLLFLKAKGLVTDRQGHLIPGKTVLHLPADSPWISAHHRNWRLKSLESLCRQSPGELHYSGVVSCSDDDRLKIQEALTKTLREILEQVQTSPEEKLVGLGIDWFQVNG